MMNFLTSNEVKTFYLIKQNIAKIWLNLPKKNTELIMAILVIITILIICLIAGSRSHSLKNKIKNSEQQNRRRINKEINYQIKDEDARFNDEQKEQQHRPFRLGIIEFFYQVFK